jgi:hypothetical protein
VIDVLHKMVLVYPSMLTSIKKQGFYVISSLDRLVLVEETFDSNAYELLKINVCAGFDNDCFKYCECVQNWFMFASN